jgi:hypothetical protein
VPASIADRFSRPITGNNQTHGRPVLVFLASPGRATPRQASPCLVASSFVRDSSSCSRFSRPHRRASPSDLNQSPVLEISTRDLDRLHLHHRVQSRDLNTRSLLNRTIGPTSSRLVGSRSGAAERERDRI